MATRRFGPWRDGAMALPRPDALHLPRSPLASKLEKETLVEIRTWL